MNKKTIVLAVFVFVILGMGLIFTRSRVDKPPVLSSEVRRSPEQTSAVPAVVVLHGKEDMRPDEGGVGLFGFTNKHYYLATKTQEKYTKPFGSDGSLSPLDYSVGIGTGLELGHFQFMFGYDYPLSNSSKDPDLSQVRQHNFRASIAYSFRKLKK